jgi:hypothetical protein
MGDVAPDKRLAWLGSRVCSALKVKEDVWKGILAGESKCVHFCVRFSRAQLSYRTERTGKAIHQYYQKKHIF